jgi:hypothetical protein
MFESEDKEALFLDLSSRARFLRAVIRSGVTSSSELKPGIGIANEH